MYTRLGYPYLHVATMPTWSYSPRFTEIREIKKPHQSWQGFLSIRKGEKKLLLGGDVCRPSLGFDDFDPKVFLSVCVVEFQR